MGKTRTHFLHFIFSHELCVSLWLLFFTELSKNIFPIMPLYRLIALGLKHFEGAFQSDELISSHLLCKSRWNFRKHVREMSGPRAPDNVIKVTSE